MRFRTVDINSTLTRRFANASMVTIHLSKIKYHLYRNVIPTIFILLIIGWLVLALTEQIQLAKKQQTITYK
ncbi:MAG: hypothetical protein GY816_17195 [Cytophagales bacterium]|nr:hypothetical protein [Cytophagales bacterium]